MKVKLTEIERESLEDAISYYQKQVDLNYPPERWDLCGSERIDPAHAIIVLFNLYLELEKLSSEELENYQVDEEVRRLILPF
jgi:hypothetical protein